VTEGKLTKGTLESYPDRRDGSLSAKTCVQL